MSELQTITVTYTEIIDALKMYFGTDIISAKLAAGMTVTELLALIQQLPGFRAVVSKSGHILGYEKIVTATVASSAAVVDSTATTTASTALAVTVSESGGTAAVTGVGASTAGTFGSFITGTLLPAVGAVATGTILGVAIDDAIYNANPEYWDEKLPTLNPETWDDIILGYDTKIPFLHNTNDGKTYMTAEALAYYTQVLQNENVLIPEKIITDNYFGYDKYDIEIHYSVGIPSSIRTTGTLRFLDTVNVNIGTYKITSVYVRNRIYNKNPFECEFSIVASTTHNDGFDAIYATLDGTNKYSHSYRCTKSYTYNGKTVYYYSNDITSSFPGASTYYTTSNPNITPGSGEIDAKKLAWLLCYGNEIEILPDGYSKHSDLTPSNIVVGEPISDTISKLRETYPELFNNSVIVDVPQSDGSINQVEWLPVQIPTGGTSQNPSSTESSQTFDGSYPDDTQKEQALDNIITPSIEVTPPVNDNTNIKNEDTPEISLPVTGAATGLGAVYVPTLEQLKNFSQWLWSNDFIDQLLKLFNNPMDAIVGLHQIYFSPTIAGSTGIQVGYLNSQVQSNYTLERFHTIDCGTISLNEKHYNVFDYSPYTNIELYLPFIGMVPLNVGDVMRSKINIKYTCDVLTGACIANVYVERDGITAVMYTFGGNCASSYPLSSGSYIGIISSIVGVVAHVGAAVATGGSTLPFSVVGIANNIMGARTNVQTSGGFGGNTGAMAIKKPYLIIRRQYSAMANNYMQYVGNPLNETLSLSNVSGYTKVEEIHLDGNVTSEEKNEIEQLLHEGIYL